MSRLPHYISRFGRLRKNRIFKKIDSKLDDKSKSELYPVLSLRFWCHAHIYSPVFTLILLDIIRDPNKSGSDTPDKIALALVMVSLGSLSFAFCDSFGGVYADKKGCKSAIGLGIWLMIGLMGFWGAVTYFSYKLSFNSALVFTGIGQLVVGLPLALIDNADTILTRKVSSKLESLDDYDRNHLEGICTQLKYAGLATVSLVGCFLYVAVHSWLLSRAALVGAILFLLTGVSQAVALIQLRRVQEPDALGLHKEDEKEKSAKRQTLYGRFRSALRAIYTDKVLAIWVLIIAVTEGWLLFSTSYFQLNALKSLIENAKGSLILILLIPITYWFLSAAASYGGSYFNKWQQGIASKKGRGNVKLRGGRVLDISYVHLIAACEVLAVMLGVYVLHLALSTIIFQSNGQQEQSGYFLSLIPLSFFAIYQFLRGFAHPLLKTTLGERAAAKSPQNLTATLSLATGAGRFFHALSAFLFAGCLLWVAKSKTEGEITTSIPTFTLALAATIVIVVLTILVLNVLCGVALDRKDKKSEAKDKEVDKIALRLLLKDIFAKFRDRAFRSTVVKGAFFVCLAMSNILAPKLSGIGFLEFNAGALPYALTFMLVDTIAETEDKASARKLWLSGICTYFVVGLLVFIAVRLPGAQEQQLQLYFNELFGENRVTFVTAFDALFQSGVLRFIFASLCSFTVAQYLDIWLFLLLKRLTQGRALWLRSNLSTFIAQTVDTIIFIGVGFWPISLPRLLTLVIGQLGVKWIFSLLYTPLLYSAVIWIENGKDSDLTPSTTY